MSQNTTIEWTDFSANLLKYKDPTGKTVWGCVKCSDGCKHCYAESMAHRFSKGGPFSLPVMKTLTPYFDEAEAAKILRSKKMSGKRVFIDDMTDLFGEWVSDEIIDRHFAVFALRPDVTFQVLTKRTERMAKMTDDPGRLSAISQVAAMMGYGEKSMAFRWPLPNVWLGTSVENQKTADDRIPRLLRCPAAVRFLSVEPMLEEVSLVGIRAGEKSNLNALKGERLGFGVAHGQIPTVSTCNSIDWVITGGESGPNARPCERDWIDSIIHQCAGAGVPCFVKQLGSNVMNSIGDTAGWGSKWDHKTDRVRLEHSKGGEIFEWPETLRVREFPKATVMA